jgi:hypothetical protein
MILHLSLSGQDGVIAQLVDPQTTHIQDLGLYDYKATGSQGLLEFLLQTMKQQGADVKTLTGLILQWGNESRFTVSRLTGVTMNTIAMTNQLPIITQTADESLESAVARLQTTTTTSIPIEYSAEPRLG